jgi:hypothetical protein
LIDKQPRSHGSRRWRSLLLPDTTGRSSLTSDYVDHRLAPHAGGRYLAA